MAQQKIVVSVCCLCYNHEKYIRQALDSILSQKTNFPFEIIVHDDASRDRSVAIIREYQEKYPGIIRPIFQKENQYSRGASISRDFLYPAAKGEFIAITECDDFWCDDNKLQKQIDALRANPDCIFCAHQTQLSREDGSILGKIIPATLLPAGMVPHKNLVRMLEEGEQFHTSSRMARSDVLKEFAHNPPDYAQSVKLIGDLPLILYLIQRGNCYYIPEVMSVYRMQSIGSYSVRLAKDLDYAVKNFTERRTMWKLYANQVPECKDAAAKQTAKMFDQEIYARMAQHTIEQMQLVRRSPYRQYYKQMPVWRRAANWIWAFCPPLYKFYHKLRGN